MAQPAPVDPGVLAAALSGAAGGGPLLVGTGTYSPHRGSERVAVLRAHGDGPLEGLWDGYLPTQGLEGFRAALGARVPTWPGELDFMAATPWEYAWTVAPAPFQLWAAAGRLAWVDGGRLWYRLGAGEPLRSLPLADLADVEADVSPDWVVRTVRLHRKDREAPIVVARQADALAQLDPTYDGFNLICDAAWAVQLGQALAAAIGRPCLVHPDLR